MLLRTYAYPVEKVYSVYKVDSKHNDNTNNMDIVYFLYDIINTVRIF